MRYYDRYTITDRLIWLAMPVIGLLINYFIFV